MLLKRFIKILASGIHSSKRLQEEYQVNGASGFAGTSDAATDTMDMLQRKEAEYYANLELRNGAGFTEVKASYKRLMKKYHPDLFNGNEEQRKIAEAITARLNEAYMYFEKKFARNS